MRLGCEKLQRLREVWVTGLKITSSSKWWEKTIWADHYPLQVRSTPTQLNSSTLCMLWAPHHKAHKGCNRSGKVLRRATRMFKRTEQLLCEEQLWRQGPFCLKKNPTKPKTKQKEVTEGNMADIYKTTSDKVKVNRDIFTTVSSSTKTRNWI